MGDFLFNLCQGTIVHLGGNSCPRFTLPSTRTFTVPTTGNYNVSATIGTAECGGCTMFSKLLLDGRLIFNEPGTSFGVATHPPVVFDKTVVPLSAGTHSVTMQMQTTAACSGFFVADFDDISIKPTTSASTPPPVGGPYFSLQVNQTSYNATSPSTIIVPLKVIWDTGYDAESVTATFMGNTTSVIPSITSVVNTTSSQLFDVPLNVPSGVQAGNYYVVIQIAEPDGDSQDVPIFVRVQ